MNVYELTEMQKEILNSELFGKNAALANIGGFVLWQQRFDLQLMKKILLQVLKENNIFALRLKKENDRYVQFFCAETEDDITTIEFYSKPRSWLYNDMKIGFDLNGPLSKFVVFGINGYCGYYIKLHNLIADAQSLSLLLGQINGKIAKVLNLPHVAGLEAGMTIGSSNSNRFSAVAAANSAAVLPTDFEMYLQQQEKSYYHSLQRVVDRGYWLHEASYWAAYGKEFGTVDGAAGNGGQIGRVTAGSIFLPAVSDKRAFSLSLGESATLSNFCLQNGISLIELTEAVLAVYLAWVNKAGLAVVCVLDNCRGRQAAANSLGLYSAILPLHIAIDRENSFIKLCAAVRAKHNQAKQHSAAPLAAMLEVYNAAGGTGGLPYEVMVSGNNMLKSGDNQFCRVEGLENGYAQLPLLIDIEEQQEISYAVNYQTKFFKAAKVQALFGQLKQLTSQAINNKYVLLKDLQCRLAEEEQ